MATYQLRSRNEAWKDQAACAGEPTELFFPDHEGTQVNPALAELCASCPVQDPCLDYAIAGHEVGIWAGTTSNERKRIAQSRRRAA